ADAQRHDFDGGHVIIDGDVFVVRMHDGGGTGAEDDCRRAGIKIEKARIRGTLTAADLGLSASNLFVALANRRNDGMVARNLGGLGIVADKPYLGRMQLHPGVFGGGACNLFNQALLHALVVLPGHRADAAFEQAVRGEGARVIAGRKAPDNAGQRVERIRIERMRDGRDALGLEISNRLDDLVAELDSADALVTFLNAGGLAVNFDLEPNAART